MGIYVSRVCFATEPPSLVAGKTALEARTGLRSEFVCTSERMWKVRCLDFRAEVDIYREENIYTLEQGIGNALYFVEQLREALVDLGGSRCDRRGQPLQSEHERLPPLLWHERQWHQKFLDKHPAIAGVLWVLIQPVWARVPNRKNTR